MYAPLDEAELDRGQRDHDRHQDHRLCRRAAEIEADHTVVLDPETRIWVARAGPPRVTL